jgi:hypothetical protein
MNEIENAQFGQGDIERNVRKQILFRKFMVSHSGYSRISRALKTRLYKVEMA